MGRDCFAHTHREDVPLEVHHVWPLGRQGPDRPENRVRVCSNAHGAVHDLLDKMIRAQTASVPWAVRRRYGKKVRRIAAAGFRAIVTRQVVAP